MVLAAVGVSNLSEMCFITPKIFRKVLITVATGSLLIFGIFEFHHQDQDPLNSIGNFVSKSQYVKSDPIPQILPTNPEPKVRNKKILYI